ncbi:MAG TPA: hypothetical protein VN743_08660, partial [Blastocatellia bacterium]|nr:hypothetical protein [Blastocatellia bacterium]
KRTYGIEIRDIFSNLDLALGSYRRAVSTIIPEMTKVAWETKKDAIEKTTPGVTREKFVYGLSDADYEKDWGKQYEKPGAFDKTLALFFRVIPKVGPFAALSFKPPTPEAERMFNRSLDATLVRYRGMIRQQRAGRMNLQNKDFDTGNPTRAGEYRLADETYAELLSKLAGNDFKEVTPDLRQNILAFYGDLNAPIATKKDKKEWRDTLQSLNRLKATSAPQATRTQ